jgi:hypothetical protein
MALWIEGGVMKSTLIAIGAGCSLLVSSCSTMDLGGSVPLPFTTPATNAKLDLDLRPIPPRFCIGLDIVPRDEAVAENETAK